MTKLKIGTCSWNYDSWIGLVYTKGSANSAGYLKEYANKYRTVEIDSWFYKFPSEKDVQAYLSNVDDAFSFSCKAPANLTLAHLRDRNNSGKATQINPDFLSPELFKRFLSSIEPMLPHIDAIMFEFEYLNKSKMPSLNQFIDNVSSFFEKIDRPVPLAIETRNQNYLTRDYFQCLQAYKITHVFSEKQFMPHIYDVYKQYHTFIADQSIIRLLGGDRKEIESKTAEHWNEIVDEKKDLNFIAEMVVEIIKSDVSLRIYVNNHYEGSAPKTIERLLKLLPGLGTKETKDDHYPSVQQPETIIVN
jgi:uncharacterized protein YecE (DUF72 family)